MKPISPLTEQERTLVHALYLVHPAGLGHELDGAGDRQWREVGERLIEADVIERNECDAGVEYRLSDNFRDLLGWTPTPHLN
jgi:hypothetical protein